jgi:hypothetical protein
MSLPDVFAAGGHELAPMLMDPIWFAVIAGAVFILIGFVTWSFRDVANRHSHKTGPVSHGDSTHGTDHH